MVYQTKEQQYYFNAPYQLAVIPKHLQSPGSLANTPSDADVAEMQLEKGDLILVATDGVFDNLFDKV